VEAGLSDRDLRALLAEDPERGWRAFVDQYTPVLLALIARDGVADRDDAGEVYVRVCERLAEDRCRRLRRHDPDKGALAAWLTVFVRHTVVDWVRSRAGRRRLFQAIARLVAFDRRVFELYYWEHRSVAEIAGLLGVERRTRVDVAEVLDALQRIDEAMTDRHRRQLLAALARTRTPVSLDDEAADALPGSAGDPEQALRAREIDRSFSAALAALPSEDAAIIRLTFVHGWSRAEVQRALHLERLTAERLASILAGLKRRLAEQRIGPSDAATPGLTFLEGGSA
jgi:DNA-directed RNA polymerase specialized sigma24 family protein